MAGFGRSDSSPVLISASEDSCDEKGWHLIQRFFVGRRQGRVSRLLSPSNPSSSSAISAFKQTMGLRCGGGGFQVEYLFFLGRLGTVRNTGMEEESYMPQAARRSTAISPACKPHPSPLLLLLLPLLRRSIANLQAFLTPSCTPWRSYWPLDPRI